MMVFLRVIRGFIGFLFVLQIFGVVIILTWLQQPNAVTGYVFGQLLFRVVVLLLFGGLFFGLRSVINRLHSKKHGVPHPVLAERRWAL